MNNKKQGRKSLRHATFSLRSCEVGFFSFPITFNRPICRCEAPRPREHLTVNQGVTGSSPVGGAIYVVRKDYYTQKSLIFKDFSCF